MKNYPLYETAYYRSFSEMLFATAKQYEHMPAITYFSRQGGEQTRTYRQLKEDAQLAARTLLSKGISGKHIAIAGENSYPWLVAFLATALAGNTAVLIDIEQPTEIIQNMISYADTDVLFASGCIGRLVQGMVGLDEIACLSLEADAFWSFCEDAGETALPEREEGTVLVYTSGTTAAPKAVELTAAAILQNAGEAIAMVKGTQKVYTPLPFYHIYGMTCGVLANLIAGAHLGINGDLKTMLQDLSAFRPETVMAVPLLAEQLDRMLSDAAGTNVETLKAAHRKYFFRGKKPASPTPEAIRIKKKILGEVSLIVCGGAHLSCKVSERLAGFGIMVLQGYGITECSPLVSVNRNLLNKPESVGIPLPGYEIKIAGNGEVLLRGKSLMRGYYKQEQATSEAFVDGWFRTGDIGSIDRQGYLHIVGRSKNVIVMKNGKKILPEEIEDYLEDVPLIDRAVVYGAAAGVETDDVKIAASVCPNPSMTAGMATYEILAAVQEEIEAINKRLPLYKQIQIVNISEQEQKTSLGKEKRNR